MASVGSRKRWMRRAGMVALALLVLAGLRAWQQRDLPTGVAPVLAGQAIDGRTIARGAEAPTLIYFWATWCPVCGLTRGTVESIATDYPVVMVALQSGSDAELKAYVAQYGLKAPLLNDPQAEEGARWGVRATPTFFVVDAQGRIRFREVGYTSEAGLRLRLWLAGW